MSLPSAAPVNCRLPGQACASAQASMMLICFRIDAAHKGKASEHISAPSSACDHMFMCISTRDLHHTRSTGW